MEPLLIQQSHSGNRSEETLNTNSKEYMLRYIHCSVIYDSQATEAAQVPVDRHVDRKAVVCLHNGMLRDHKKTPEILPFLTARMGLEGVKLKEISCSGEDKYHMTSLTCGI